MIINIAFQNFPPADFALVSIGDPPVEERLHIDTWSDLSWVLHDPFSVMILRGHPPSAT